MKDEPSFQFVQVSQTTSLLFSIPTIKRNGRIWLDQCSRKSSKIIPSHPIPLLTPSLDSNRVSSHLSPLSSIFRILEGSDGNDESACWLSLSGRSGSENTVGWMRVRWFRGRGSTPEVLQGAIRATEIAEINLLLDHSSSIVVPPWSPYYKRACGEGCCAISRVLFSTFMNMIVHSNQKLPKNTVQPTSVCSSIFYTDWIHLCTGWKQQ